MKKSILLLVFLMALIFSSCSSQMDLSNHEGSASPRSTNSTTDSNTTEPEIIPPTSKKQLSYGVMDDEIQSYGKRYRIDFEQTYFDGEGADLWFIKGVRFQDVSLIISMPDNPTAYRIVPIGNIEGNGDYDFNGQLVGKEPLAGPVPGGVTINTRFRGIEFYVESNMQPNSVGAYIH